MNTDLIPDLKNREAPPEASGVLQLLCRKCTRIGRYPAHDRAIATMQAHRKGWHFERDGKAVCPRCPK